MHASQTRTIVLYNKMQVLLSAIMATYTAEIKPRYGVSEPFIHTHNKKKCSNFWKAA